MKKIVVIVGILALALATISSCKKGSQGKRSFLPNVTGRAGEVLVVLPRDLKNDTITGTFRSILGDDYPFLPQSEPMFDMIFVPSENFGDIFRSHRNIVYTKVDKSVTKSQITVQRDVWASPQTVISFSSPTWDSLRLFVMEQKETFIKYLEQAERDRIVQNAMQYEATGTREFLKKKFGVSLYLPKGYRINLDTTNFAWISHETPEISQGVLVYEFPYTDANTFTSEYLVERRNEFVGKFIPGPTNGSYMITSTFFPPQYTPLMYKNRYFGQIRGLWDVHKHPMGGPYISLVTLDEAKNRIIVVEGFVYAPGKQKRNYLRQLEAVLFTFAFEKPENDK
ncbi:MAG TPA: DUF4837 family protein [Tenuifilaceae bacterium]|nr:DUF4837 family protein [Tenuifilaceae bacterium]